ncbi:MAG TPA: ABC transporter ATP-binding protein, partial [Rhizobiales bacterium]|nr:ABC transporter ATP-binding protein [Hyphomicrobiales bacterium]
MNVTDGQGKIADNLPRSFFGFAWRHTKRQQLWIVFVVLASMPTYFLSLDLPKRIVNGPIQGSGFETPGATGKFLHFSLDLPRWLYPKGTLELYPGFNLDRWQMLVMLSLSVLTLVIINGLFKFYINTFKGLMGERMLRRLRFELVDRVLRFPMPRFKHIKPSEVASMVKDEVEPIGGFVGEAFVTPVFLGGQAITAMGFIMLQSFWLGLIAGGIVAVQAVLIPRLRRRLIELGRQRQLTARKLAGRVGELVDGIANVHVNDTSNLERADIAARLGRIFAIRYELFKRKYFVKFLNNFLAQVTPFLFYLIGGYFALAGSLDIGQLVAVIAAYGGLPSPVRELISWDQQRLDVQVKYTQVTEQFHAADMMEAELQKAVFEPVPHLKGGYRLTGVSITDETGTKLLNNLSMEISLHEKIAVVGPLNSGGEVLADVLARVIPETAGAVRLACRELSKLPEAETGRRIGYVPSDAPLFVGSLGDNLLYGLKHAPLRQAEYTGDQLVQHKWEMNEARMTGNPV